MLEPASRMPEQKEELDLVFVFPFSAVLRLSMFILARYGSNVGIATLDKDLRQKRRVVKWLVPCR